MPTVRAISGALDTARMAWPHREHLRNAMSARYPTTASATRQDVQVREEDRPDDDGGAERRRRPSASGPA